MSPNKIKRDHKFLCKFKVKLDPENAQGYLNTQIEHGHYTKGDPNKLGLYTCMSCGWLHVGHKPEWAGR